MSQAIRAQVIIEFSDGKNLVRMPKYAELMLNLTAMNYDESVEYYINY